MAKSYWLSSGVHLVCLTLGQAGQFVTAVANEVPTNSFGSIHLKIRAEGGDEKSASTEAYVVKGNSAEELARSIAEFKAAPKPQQQADVTYMLKARLALVNLPFDDGKQVVEAALANMPPNTLESTWISAENQESAGAGAPAA